MIGRFIPTVAVSSAHSPPWAINPPRQLLRTKSSSWNSFKTARSAFGRYDSRTNTAWLNFISANDDVKLYAVRSQVQYEKDIANQIGTSPKLFHSYIRHKRVARPSLGPLRLSDGSLSDDPQKMADCFASKFASVFDAAAPDNQAPNRTCSSIMPDLQITPEMVTNIIQIIDKNSSPGIDNIHPRLLKELVGDLAMPLQAKDETVFCLTCGLNQ